MAKPELIQLFPTPILIIKYEENFTQELEYIKNIEYGRKNDVENDGYNSQSINTFLLEEPELKNIKKFIEFNLNQYSSCILEYRDEFIITQSWANKNKKGEVHHEHIHPNSIISGVFYFQIDGNSAPIQFKKDRLPELKPVTKTGNNFNSQTFLLPLNNGELIIFPSTLIHSVSKNNSNEDRISLSFNSFQKGSIGQINELTFLPINKCL